MLSSPSITKKPKKIGRLGADFRGCTWKVGPIATSPCLIWGGTRNNGYGSLYIGERRLMAHRHAWEQVYGPIPSGLFVCHHCDVPPCCNPDHLFLGTAAENVADREAKGRTHRGPNTRKTYHSPFDPKPSWMPYGEQHGSAKLSDKTVFEIRCEYLAQATPAEILAERYGVHKSAIYHVIHGRTWKHVPFPATTPN